MASNQSERHKSPAKLVFNNVGENLYRLEPTGVYYALLKRGGKQFRRSLKTNDRALANRRLSDLRLKIANLALTDTRNATFGALAKSWLDGVRHALKPSSVSRREVCIKGLTPFFKDGPGRWMDGGQSVLQSPHRSLSPAGHPLQV
jgi:hypothetical protein